MEHFALTLVTPPAAEPMTLADAKLWCRIDSGDTSQDVVLTLLIQAARQRCEHVSRRALITQTWRLSLDRFPGLDFVTPDYPGWEYLRLGADGDPRCLRLPRPPLLAVTSITYVDTAGVTQTLAASQYQVDADGQLGRVFPSYGNYWPVVRPQANAVAVTYTAGYGPAAADVPTEIRARLLAHVAYSFENREQLDDDYLDRLFACFAVGSYF